MSAGGGTWFRTALGAFAIVAAISGPAHAQPDQARRFFVEGDRLEGLGEREDAVAAWERSYRAQPNWRALRRSATALEALGRTADAVEKLELLLRRHGIELSARDRRVAESDLQRLARRVATLTVLATPNDARVTVGSHVVRSGEAVRVSAGTHTVTVTRAGYRRQRGTVRVDAGASREVRISLEAEAEVASLDVRTRPAAAEVYVDGERRGLSPIGLRLAVGGHRLRVELPGYAPHEREITLVPGAWERIEIPLAPLRELYEEAWLWVLVGLVAAGVAATFIALWATRVSAPTGTIGNVLVPTEVTP